MIMAWVSSAHAGLQLLHGIMAGMIPDISVEFGYRPLVVWNAGQVLKKPPDTRVWFRVVNMYDSDRQRNIGRPRRYEVLGSYNVFLHYPKLVVVERKVDAVLESLKTAFRYQNVLSPYNVRSSAVNQGRNYDKWNTKYLSHRYRFQYFVA